VKEVKKLGRCKKIIIFEKKNKKHNNGDGILLPTRVRVPMKRGWELGGV
jgi:hypothetical protein